MRQDILDEIAGLERAFIVREHGARPTMLRVPRVRQAEIEALPESRMGRELRNRLTRDGLEDGERLRGLEVVLGGDELRVE